ncbi:MAG TPA: xanthine dehydrogenase family protein molybdopterin-binding subunit [Vicinamibacteria bacterium]|nr:xanthine dehydrogenase family protein molybdopterin-binding subunit [Vicinamibacteria bacterium]
MAKTTPRLIGAHVRRREDPSLVKGEGRYVADIPLEGALTMAFVRSPYPHARVLSVDSRNAVGRKGVVAVFTAADVNPHLQAPLPVLTEPDCGRYHELYVPDRFPLATDRARHVGDPVAVLLAEDPYLAADAVEAVEVRYEPLGAVATPEAALAAGAPVLHDALGTNRAFVWSLEGGDVKGAFQRAARTVTLEAHIQRLVPNAMEPRAVAATYEHERGITLWSSTQFPHMLRDFLAGILGIEKEEIHVIAPEVGGGFGAKCNVYAEEVLAPFLARRVGRAVRWTATRTEDYLATSHGRDQSAVLKLAADTTGRVTGADLRLTMDCGAYYSRVTPIIPALTGAMMVGVYDIRNVRAEAVGVFTNKVVSEPYRGAGRPEAAYFIERAMDLLAGELDMDPSELRRRNFISKDEFPHEVATGITYDSGDYERSLDEALKRIDYARLRSEQIIRRREGGRLIGIGLACYVEICGFGPWEFGGVRVDEDGRVTVLTGTSPHGQGHETSWAQIAAETLQVDWESIVVVHGDTRVVPRGIGTFGSRSAPVGGAAVLVSSERVRDGAKEIAADLLEASPDDMTLEEGRFFVTGVPGRSLSWEDVARHAHSSESLAAKLRSETTLTPRGETFPFGTHAAVVSVDPETGEVAIERYVSVDDCGRVINPLLVEGQIHGGIAQGIGQALFESACYDEQGSLVTGSLLEYALPRAENLPSYETNRTETPTPLNALGAKGVGEAATIGSTPAVVSAVVDALYHLGVRHIDTPITPEKIWKRLRSSASTT